MDCLVKQVKPRCHDIAVLNAWTEVLNCFGPQPVNQLYVFLLEVGCVRAEIEDLSLAGRAIRSSETAPCTFSLAASFPGFADLTSLLTRGHLGRFAAGDFARAPDAQRSVQWRRTHWLTVRS